MVPLHPHQDIQYHLKTIDHQLEHHIMRPHMVPIRIHHQSYLHRQLPGQLIEEYHYYHLTIPHQNHLAKIQKIELPPQNIIHQQPYYLLMLIMNPYLWTQYPFQNQKYLLEY